MGNKIRHFLKQKALANELVRKLILSWKYLFTIIYRNIKQFCFPEFVGGGFLFTKYSKAKAILLSTVNLCMYQSSGSQYKYSAQSRNSSYGLKRSLQIAQASVWSNGNKDNDGGKQHSENSVFPAGIISPDFSFTWWLYSPVQEAVFMLSTGSQSSGQHREEKPTTTTISGFLLDFHSLFEH